MIDRLLGKDRTVARGRRGRMPSIAAIALAMLFSVVAVALAVSYAPQPAQAGDVTPVLVDGNPDCGDSGLEELVRIDPVEGGTFPVAGGSITVAVNSSAKTFDWTSTVSIGLIVVKGGPNANLYLYDPASFGDTGLHSPVNPNNDMFYGLSHISFCDPGVVATATPTATHTPPPPPTPTDTPPPNTPTPTDTPPPNTPTPVDTPQIPNTPTDTPPPADTPAPTDTPEPTATLFSEVSADPSPTPDPEATAETEGFPPTGTGGPGSSSATFLVFFFIALAGLGLGLLALGFWRSRLQH